MEKFLPLSVPNFCGNEKAYVEQAVVSEWVSTGGSRVTEFEQVLADYLAKERSVATASGTAALHLALLCLGVQPDDEILVPTLTFVAAVNPVRYVGAHPVFFDCDDTLCIDTTLLRNFCEQQCDFDGTTLRNRKTGRRVSGIIPVHVFGNIADMEAIMDMAERYKLFVLEDATEALGSKVEGGRYAGMMAGTIGDFGAYSFNGNKLITTGSGGALVAKDLQRLERAKYLSTQAKDDETHFVHGEIGYNYRMTNVQAAMGVAQMEQLEKFIKTKNDNYDSYLARINDIDGLSLLPFREDIRSNKWFYSVLVGDEYPICRDELMAQLQKHAIGTRPIWSLIHTLKPYAQYECHTNGKGDCYRQRIINVPCSTSLTEQEVQRVCDTLQQLSRG